MTAVSKEKFDVAIVGGGPAGSSAAIRLAKAGLSVLLAEQKKFPREKLCGEFISPECLVHFDELGVLPGIASAGGTDYRETVFYGRNGKGVAVASKWFGNSSALGLSRAEMDARLLDKAREFGADVREQTAASGLLFDGSRVSGIRLKDTSGFVYSVKANLTIDATGRTRAVARYALTQPQNKTRAKFVAFKTHLLNARTASGACEIYSYRGGYGGCNQVENGLYNLCFIVSAEDAKRIGSDPERIMREVVFTNKRAASVLRNSAVASSWHAVPIENFGRGKLVPVEGLITIGDAAVFIDPFTGSGILMALESSKIAAAAIETYFRESSNFRRFEAEYENNYADAFDSRLRICRLLRYCAFVPFFAETAIAALSVSTRFRRGIARATRI